MELVNDFTVSAGIEETWTTLIDLELIAPCMPGAELTEIEGETHRGLVKIKVGPITAKFKGEAHFVERDADNHRAVLKADGRDTGGKGNAAALITAQLSELDPERTKVVVTTDLTITGKVAQFGRGALADVSDKLLKQFVHNLETTVLNRHDTDAALAAGGDAQTGAFPPPSEAPAEAPGAPSSDAVASSGDAGADVAADSVAASSAAATPAQDSAPAAPAAAPTVRKIDSKPAEPIDLLETAGSPILKRLAPVVAGLLVVLLLLRRRSR